MNLRFKTCRPYWECDHGVVIRVDDEDQGQSGSNPLLSHEGLPVALGPSHSLSLTYPLRVVSVNIKWGRGELKGVKRWLESLISGKWDINIKNKIVVTPR